MRIIGRYANSYSIYEINIEREKHFPNRIVRPELAQHPSERGVCERISEEAAATRSAASW